MLKKANKKVLLGAMAVLFALGFIIISSFFPFIIDPSRWQTAEFLSDELIISSIVVFGTVAVLFIGQAGNAQDERSEIARAKVRFDRARGPIRDYNRFSQWVKKVLQARDRDSIRERMMRAVGIDDKSLLALTNPEIDSLVDKPGTIGGKPYCSITEKQARELKRIKEADIGKGFVEPDYYLVVKDLERNRTISEKSGSEGRKKAALLSYSIISRLVVGLIIAMVFASLVYDTATGDTMEKATAWMKFISRLFALCSSSFMGYMIGAETNNIDAAYVNMKATVLEAYAQDITFVEETREEIALQQMEKAKTLEKEGKPAIIGSEPRTNP